jgi:hypothetical protein
MVFLYTVFGAVAAILAGLFLKPFADSIGSKPLLILTNGFLMLCAIVWAVVDPHANWAVFLVLGFVMFFFIRMWLMLTSRLVIKSIPDDAKINYTAMMNFVAAVSALGVGLAGGWLADLGHAAAVSPLHGFSFTYLFAAVLASAAMLLCLGLKDPGSLTLRETIAVLFSTKNLRALLDAHQLGNTGDSGKRETILLSLEQNDAPIATDELRYRMKTPLSWEKERIFRSLFSVPRPQLLPEILEEARDRDSYNRLGAIFALGAYPEEPVRQLLHELLKEERPEVVSTALKSLARIGDSGHMEEVNALLSRPDISPTVELDCINALTRMDEERSYLGRIFDLVRRDRSTRFRELAYVVCIRRLDLVPPISDFFWKENIRAGRGFRELVEESKQVAVFYRNARQLLAWYDAGELERILHWTLAQLTESTDNPSKPESGCSWRGHLLSAMSGRAGQNEAPDRVDVMVAVYLTFQCLS